MGSAAETVAVVTSSHPSLKDSPQCSPSQGVPGSASLRLSGFLTALMGKSLASKSPLVLGTLGFLNLKY